MSENGHTSSDTTTSDLATVRELEVSGERAQTAMLTLVFTELVEASRVRQDLSDEKAAALIEEHHSLVRQTLARFGGEEVERAGDSFLIVFGKPSDAARFALTLQHELQESAGSGPAIRDRIGIHLGETLTRAVKGSALKPGDLSGLQVDLCARIMSLAGAGQILLSRAAFDSARQVLKREELAAIGDLRWLNHGPYRLKGVDEPVEICEAGCAEIAPLEAPSDCEKAHRHLSPDSEPVLGWRPSIGVNIPETQWTLEKKLGEGGFGEVWLARHRQLRETRVFKFCFRADRVRSLKREVTLFRLLREKVGEHRNIVGVQEVQFEKPPFYLIMDYAEGTDLKAWCDERGGASAIPLATRWEIVAQTADALRAAHEAGVIHRDVKPSNILVSGDKEKPESIRVRLTDFGIGQLLSPEALAGMTQWGFTQTLMDERGASQAGTYMYLAPELLAGKPASPASDIYSLGVVYFQLLAGDFNQPLTPDWVNHVPEALLMESVRPCLSGNPDRRASDLKLLANDLRGLAVRKEAEAALSRRRDRLRTACFAPLYLLSVAAIAGAALHLLAESLTGEPVTFAQVAAHGLFAVLAWILKYAAREGVRPNVPGLVGLAAISGGVAFTVAIAYRLDDPGDRSNSLSAAAAVVVSLVVAASFFRVSRQIHETEKKRAKESWKKPVEFLTDWSPQRRKRALLGALGLAALTGLTLTLERLQGKRELQQWKAGLAAAGEPLTGADILPEFNEAAARYRAAFDAASLNVDDSVIYALGGPSPVESIDRLRRRPVWKRKEAAAKNYNWAALVESMKAADEDLKAYHRMLETPPATGGHDWSRAIADPAALVTGPFPNFVRLRKVAQALHTAVLFELQRGDVDRAYEHLVALTQLSLVAREDPMVVALMIRVAVTGMGADAVWEAMQAEGWSEPNLRDLQTRWERIEFLKQLRLAMQAERLHVMGDLSYARTTSYSEARDLYVEYLDMFGVKRSMPGVIRSNLDRFFYVPIWKYAWSHKTELHVLRSQKQQMDVICELCVGVPWTTVRPKLNAVYNGYQKPFASFRFKGPLWRSMYHNLWDNSSLPYSRFDKAFATLVRNDSSRRQAVIAIAIKRFRLKRQRLPESLDELSPEFLKRIPNDIVNNSSLQYVRYPDGSFALYSVGENGLDDGGEADDRVWKAAAKE